MAELSTKPYLIRAIHEWCGDSGHTPYLAVAVDDRTVVPRAYVKNGEIVLNVSTSATNRLTIGNELIEFQARFGGVAHELSIPVENVTAIYARETGHGMAFDVPKPPAVKEDRRAPRPAAVPTGPRPVGVESSPPPLLAPPVGAAPPGLPAPASPPAAVETDVAPPLGDAAPSGLEGEARQPLSGKEPTSPAPSPDDGGEGGGRPKRSGRPKLTRVK
jgi:stringent starvation protein B